jgi:hypothetical protein
MNNIERQDHKVFGELPDAASDSQPEEFGVWLSDILFPEDELIRRINTALELQKTFVPLPKAIDVLDNPYHEAPNPLARVAV